MCIRHGFGKDLSLLLVFDRGLQVAESRRYYLSLCQSAFLFRFRVESVRNGETDESMSFRKQIKTM